MKGFFLFLFCFTFFTTSAAPGGKGAKALEKQKGSLVESNKVRKRAFALLFEEGLLQGTVQISRTTAPSFKTKNNFHQPLSFLTAVVYHYGTLSTLHQRKKLVAPWLQLFRRASLFPNHNFW